MTNLPVHHHTGLRAIGLRRDGRPIYPVKGGSVDPLPAVRPAVPAPPGQAPPPPAVGNPPAPNPPLEAGAAAAAPPPGGDPADTPLGPAGERALAAERDARKALERQLAELSPLKKLAEALGAGTPAAGGKSEIELLTDRFAQHEAQLAEERAARFRAEVAAEKGLTAQQAARLNGSTREELVADADALLALFPAAAVPRAPAPDLSQGARGGQPANLEAQIAAAKAAGNFRQVIALEHQKLKQPAN